MRFKMMLAATAAVLLVLAAACGSDGGEEAARPSPTPETPPVSSSGSVAPDVFMTFEGRRYQARDVGTDLVSSDEVELAGSTEDLDVDRGDRVERAVRDGAQDPHH